MKQGSDPWDAWSPFDVVARQQAAQFSRRLVGVKGTLDSYLVELHVPRRRKRRDRREEPELTAGLPEHYRQQRRRWPADIARSPLRPHIRVCQRIFEERACACVGGRGGNRLVKITDQVVPSADLIANDSGGAVAQLLVTRVIVEEAALVGHKLSSVREAS
jgi:hypothetical protein